MTVYTLLALSFGLLLSLAVSRVVYALYFSPYKDIPGPKLCKITRYWAVYHDMWLRRARKIREWHSTYGDVVLVAPGEVSVSSASLTKEIYGSTGRHPKSHYFDNFMFYGERPIFCALGVKEHRQLLKRTFAFYQPTSIYQSATLEPICRNARKLVDLLKTEIKIRPTVDVLLFCNYYSFDNITNLTYGPRLCARTIEDNECEERVILQGWKEVEVWNNLSYNFPLVHKIIRGVLSWAKRDPAFLSAEERLIEWNMEKVISARTSPDKMVPGSLLHQLTHAKTPDGEPLSISWIAAEILDNLHAAQTTVALALTFALWNLARQPQWQDRVRQELRSLPRSADGFPEFAAIMNAPVLDACVRESSRVNPLSSGRAERVVPATKAYGAFVLPAGTLVSSSTLSLHHRPDVFQDAQSYRPDRWLNADEETLRVMESCLVAFGYGARLCLGKAFALAEIKLLVAAVVMEFEFCNDPLSSTTGRNMEQLGTQNAMPRGQRCDLSFRLSGVETSMAVGSGETRLDTTDPL
ncbi:hypothetical protein E4U42_001866 [Claviceps africana]|uniref:Uncharacterized protein n=1 Tax=Claviceps africana TaxID=83212 RepID=A0A8K0JCY9_9HYPO|nr:hypothetical protein E4U42_001866 [Claviceps africana]